MWLNGTFAITIYAGVLAASRKSYGVVVEVRDNV
jgi:hypothetical protein